MSTRTTKPVAAAKAGTRYSAGSAFQTSNPTFAAGRLQGRNGDYANAQALLDLLPQPEEGCEWTVKLFSREAGKYSLHDVVLEVAPKRR